MSELAPYLRQPINPAHAITGAVTDWLAQEIKSSMEGSNSYLDEMGSFIETTDAKKRGHYDRLEAWTGQFEKDPADMAAIEKQMYGVLTGLSGAFRTQCYVLAKGDGEGYARRRTGWHYGPLGINISETVSGRLEAQFGEEPDTKSLGVETIDVDNLAQQTKDVNELRYDTVTRFCADHKRTQGLLRPLGHFARLAALQRDWLELGTDYIAYGAQLNNGSLEKVTFLEPKPITAAGSYGPFAKAA